MRTDNAAYNGMYSEYAGVNGSPGVKVRGKDIGKLFGYYNNYLSCTYWNNVSPYVRKLLSEIPVKDFITKNMKKLQAEYNRECFKFMQSQLNDIQKALKTMRKELREYKTIN